MARVTGPAGLDGGAAGYCKSGRHLWLCKECRERCCNNQYVKVSLATRIEGRTDMHWHAYLDPELFHYGYGWERREVAL